MSAKLPELDRDLPSHLFPNGWVPGKLYPKNGKLSAIFWNRRYNALHGADVPAPVFDSGDTTGTQLHPGSTSIRLPDQTNLGIGQVDTVAPAPGQTAWTESWGTNNLAALDNPTGPVDLVYVSTAGGVTTMGLPTVTATSETELVFAYLAFPSNSVIDGLLGGRPPQVFNAQTFTVSTVKAGVATVSGRLYREWRVSAPGDGPTRRDFWVLFGNYELPSPVATTRLSLVPAGDPNNHPDLKSFLVFCRSQAGDKATWKFVDVPYVWQPV